MNRTRFTSMLLGCALSAAWPQSAWATPRAKAASIAKSSCQPPAKARGIRLRVRSFFRVTNAEDGFKDNDVEVFGVVNFNGQPVWKVASKNAIRAVKFVYDGIDVTERTYDVIYATPATWTLRVDGYLSDYDKGSGNDAMWNPSKLPRILDIKQRYEQADVGRNGIYVWAGDLDSESAELVFVISRESYIY